MANNLGVHDYTIGGMFDTWGDAIVADLAILNKMAGDALVKSDTSGPITLSTTDCQNFAFQFTGSGSTTVDYRVPDSIARFWWAQNARATGSVTIRCAAGGTSVTLAAGEKRLVYSDGTNCADLTILTIAISGVSGLQTALDAKQPLDSDLTAIAALTTTSFGRAFLALADAAAARTAIGAVIGTNVQAYNANLTTYAGTAPTAAGLALLDDAAASNQRTTLGLGTAAIIDETTTAQFLANTASKALSTDQVWAGGTEVTLTDAATIALDMSLFINAKVTLGGNRALGTPTNTKNGQSGSIRIIQDGTGSRTLSFASAFKFEFGANPVLSTAASSTDVLNYKVLASGIIQASLSKAIA